MKAAVLETIDAPLVIGEVELTPLTYGQVLVRVLVSGICGSQLQEIAGNKGNAKFVPHLLGHEACGIVEEIGEGVTTVAKGDKVVMHWRKGEGIESDFPKYIYKGKEISSGKVTTFSEYSIVSENRVTKVPHDTPDELAALLGCSLSTALGAINSEARIQPGESLLVVGAGGLGANLIRAAKLAGASPIIAMDVHEHKRDWIRAIGADFYINAATENVADALAAATGLTSVDVIIDTSGAKRAIESTLPLLSGKGRFIFLGQPKPGETIEIQNALHLFEGEGKSLKATQGGRFEPHDEIPRYLKLHDSGALRFDDLVTHRTTLDEINEALDLLRAGKAARIMVHIAS
jgi:S-(hydroxymethyl)glutathione dehydrogenase / alcohol dehydrogenase